MANQARLAFLAVTHRYKPTHCLWLEQFQIAESGAGLVPVLSGKGGHRTSSSGLAQPPHTGQLACSRPRPVLGKTALGAAIGVGVAVVVCRRDQAVIRARSATSWRR